MKHSNFIGKFRYGESRNIHQKIIEEVIKEIGLVETFLCVSTEDRVQEVLK